MRGKKDGSSRAFSGYSRAAGVRARLARPRLSCQELAADRAALTEASLVAVGKGLFTHRFLDVLVDIIQVADSCPPTTCEMVLF